MLEAREYQVVIPITLYLEQNALPNNEYTRKI